MRLWLLDHFGLARPFRFERTLMAAVALVVLLAMAILAFALWQADGLKAGTQRATYFLYLLALVLGALVLLRRTRLAM
ncbi:MAG: hypothetical protein E6G95_08440, partial [Alphaproteobacteria bacterium]